MNWLDTVEVVNSGGLKFSAYSNQGHDFTDSESLDPFYMYLMANQVTIILHSEL